MLNYFTVHMLVRLGILIQRQKKCINMYEALKIQLEPQEMSQKMHTLSA